MRVKGMSAYIRMRKVRGQVPGTTCNGTRTNSAINNTGPELHKSARGSGAVPRLTEAPNRSPEVPKHGAIRWRHIALTASESCFATNIQDREEKSFTCNNNSD